MADWFYVDGGRAIGPLSRIELEAAVRAHRVSPDTLVCEEGQSEWRLARRVPGLVPPKVLKAWQASVAAAARVEPPPPPAPPSPVAAPAAAPAPPGTPGPAASAAAGVRRHATLLAVILVAALLGGGLGAMVVLRLASRPPAPAEPAAAQSQPIPAAPGAAGVPTTLRPKLPAGPEALPARAASAVTDELARLGTPVGEYDAAAEAFLAAGGLDAATLATRESVAERIAALQALRDRNEALRRLLAEAPEAVRREVRAGGETDEVADAAARRLRAELSSHVRRCETDARMHDVASEALSLLEESFGAWSVGADRTLTFAVEAGEDAPQRYARLLEDAAALTEE